MGPALTSRAHAQRSAQVVQPPLSRIRLAPFVSPTGFRGLVQLPLPRSIAAVLWPGHVTTSVCVLGFLPWGLYALSRGFQGSHRRPDASLGWQGGSLLIRLGVSDPGPFSLALVLSPPWLVVRSGGHGWVSESCCVRPPFSPWGWRPEKWGLQGVCPSPSPRCGPAAELCCRVACILVPTAWPLLLVSQPLGSPRPRLLCRVTARRSG